jgi:release factor glutamine methyltransferase
VNSDYTHGVNTLVDILVWNPPYVPTPSEEVHTAGITQSWAGGIDGREIVDKFLSQQSTNSLIHVKN